jgi:signal transduction histidine kinase
VVTRAGVSGNAWTSIWLPALLDGRERSQLRVAPISHGGELLGLIVVERPAEADAFSEEDDRVLTELARQAGLAFYNVQLDAALQTTLDELRKQADELRESRARIVATGDAERRRVERDLHDGAQQHLVALAVNLRLAQDIIGDDPGAGAEMLAQMAEDVQVTIRELRELAHGIYPAILAEAGLASALATLAEQAPLPIELGEVPPERYSTPVETAAYVTVTEAIANAAERKATVVSVNVAREDKQLVVQIEDDGAGGSELLHLADRMGALGGSLEVAPHSLRAEIPCE